ncbi:hypothetical protein ABVT39_014762 [Epinephelus coioides]
MDMDIRIFYGRKQQECAVRDIPSESEDRENQPQDSERRKNKEIKMKRRVKCLTSQDGEKSTTPTLMPTQNSRASCQQLMTACPPSNTSEFFCEDIFEVIVEESNLYAIQCDPNKPLNLTTNELEQFLGTLVYMSLFGLSATQMFWNKATRVSQVADTMTLNRWEAIKKSLHINNNKRREEDDALYKILPLVTHLTSKLVSIPMSEKLAVDEQMVSFKGRRRLKQYLPSKPKSVPLVVTLAQQGIRCTGTVRGNRLPGVNLKNNADLKRAGRGAFEQKMAMSDQRNDTTAGMEQKDEMKLYTFKSYIAEGLCIRGKSLEKKRGRPSLSIAGTYEEKRRRGPTAPIPDPLDQSAHWLIMTGDKARCSVPGCNGTPKAMCRTCNVHLCFTPDRNCFLRFHIE